MKKNLLSRATNSIVGEMQAKLLQKIEELTLYVIQQEKKNLELEQKLETLQTALSQKE